MVSQTPAEARLTSGLSDMSDARLRALTEHALEIITVQSADGQSQMFGLYTAQPNCWPYWW